METITLSDAKGVARLKEIMAGKTWQHRLTIPGARPIETTKQVYDVTLDLPDHSTKIWCTTNSNPHSYRPIRLYLTSIAQWDQANQKLAITPDEGYLYEFEKPEEFDTLVPPA